MENLYVYDPKSIITARIRLEETCIPYKDRHYCCKCNIGKKMHGLPYGNYCTMNKINNNSYLITGIVKDCLPIGYNFVIFTCAHTPAIKHFHEVTERTFIQAIAAIENKVYEKERSSPGYYDEVESSQDSEMPGKADLPNDKLELYKQINKLLMNYVEQH